MDLGQRAPPAGNGAALSELRPHGLDTAVAALTTFAAAVEPRPPALFERDWREEINLLVDGWCRAGQLARRGMSAAQRRELVAHLDGKGVFGVRHSATHVATALGVSRATVYGLLKACRQRPVPDDALSG